MAQVKDEEIYLAPLEARQPSAVKMVLLQGVNQRRYKKPSHDEVAIFLGDNGVPPATRESVIYPRDYPLRTITSMSANLDLM